MRGIIYSSKIKEDLELYLKRGEDLDLFYEVVEKIANGVPLDPSNEDHPLKGKFSGKKACHIEPD